MDINLDWQILLLAATTLSSLALIATVLGVPWVIARLPHDYFSRAQRSPWHKSAKESVFAKFLGVLKNVFGAVLVLLGLVMLVTPGQGLLTLLTGLLLMNFPGKYQLERWLVMRPGILRGLNWLRRRKNQPPFEAPITPD
ncbi:MAG: PGPGW domain-containing protein [Halioglobus sp.]